MRTLPESKSASPRCIIHVRYLDQVIVSCDPAANPVEQPTTIEENVFPDVVFLLSDTEERNVYDPKVMYFHGRLVS